MFTENYVTAHEVNEHIFELDAFPAAFETQTNGEIAELLSRLNPEIPWGERQATAQKLGFLRCQEAVPALLNALPGDPFWMVRCAIIQALEMINDAAAIPALEQVAANDAFHVVRSYAAKAVIRLS